MAGSFSASGLALANKDRYDFLIALYGSGVIISILGIIFTPRFFKKG